MSFGSGGNLGTAVLELEVDSRNFERGLKDAERTADRSTRNIGRSISDIGRGMANTGQMLTTRLTLPLAAAGGAALKFAGDAETAGRRLHTTFGGEVDQINQYLVDLQEIAPASMAELQNSASNAMGTLITLGVEQGAANAMTEEALEVTANLAAHMDQDFTEVLGRVNSAYAGNTQGLRDMAFNINQAMIDSKAFELGLVEQGEAADGAARAQAVHALVMEQMDGFMDAAANQADTFNFQMRRMWAQVQDAGAALAQDFLPYVTQLVSWFSSLIDRFMDLDDSTRRWIVIIGGVVAAIGPAMLILGKLLVVVGSLVSPIGLVVAGIAALVAVFATDFLGIRTAVIDTFESIMDRIGGFQDAFTTFRQALSGEWVDDDSIMPLHRAFGLVGNAIRTVIETAQDLWSTLRERLAPAFELIRNNLDLVIGPLGAIIATVGGVIDGFGKDGLSGAVRGGASALSEFIGRMIDFAGDLAGILLPILMDAGRALYEWIAPMVGPALEKLGEWADALIGWITGTGLPWLRDSISEWGGALWGWVTDNVVPALDALWGFLQTVGSWIVDTGVPFLTEQAGGLASALWEWISEAVPPALERLGEFLTSIRDWFINEGIPGIENAIRGGASALADAIAGLFESGADEGVAKAGGGVLAAIGVIAWKFVDWVAPIIPPLLKALGGMLLDLGTWIVTEAVPAIAEKLLEWGTAFVEWVWPLIPPLLEALGGLLSDLGSWIIDTALPTIGEKLAEWGSAFWGWVSETVPPLLEALGGLLVDLGTWIVTTAVPTIAEKLWEWGTAFASWAADAIPPMLESLGGLLLDLGEWIVTTAVPTIAGKLVEWGTAFWEWAVDAVPPMLEKLGELLLDLGTWIVTTAVPEIAKKLLEWGTAFAEWAADAIPPMLSELGSLLVDLGGWIVNTAAPEIGKKLLEWGTAFAGWVADTVPDLLRELGSLLTDLGRWIIDTAAPEIGKKLLEWGSSFVDWVGDTVPDLLRALGGLLEDIGRWIVNDAAPELLEHGKTLGRKLVDGLDALKNAIQDALKAPFEWFRDQFDWDTVTGAATTAWNAIESFIDTAYDAMVGVLRAPFDWFTDTLSWDNVTSVATDAWDAIERFIDGAYNAMVDVLRAPFDWFTDTFSWDNVTRAATDMWDGIVRFVEDNYDVMEKALKAPFEWLRDNVGSIMTTAGNNIRVPLNLIIDGMNTMGGGVVGALNWLGNRLDIGALSNLSWNDLGRVPAFADGGIMRETGMAIVGEEGPELVMLPAGAQVIPANESAAIMAGIDGPMPEMGQHIPDGMGGWFLDEAISEGAGVVSGLFSGAVQAVGTALSWAWGGLTDAGSAIVDFIREGATSAFEWMVGNFPIDLDLPGDLTDLGTAVVSQIKDGLSGFVRDLFSALEDEIPEPTFAVDDGGVPVSLGGWYRPASGVVTQGFGHTAFSRSSGWYGPAGHTGIDIANGFGTPIRAANDGTVGTAGWLGGFGNAIILRHADNLRTLYGHMQRLLVSVGQMVSGGQQIGEMGSTGASTGSHLHFELHRNGVPINPAGIVPFADGGIVTEPTLALIGEAGPEAVIPLSGNYGMKWAPSGIDNAGPAFDETIGAIVDKYIQAGIDKVDKARPRPEEIDWSIIPAIVDKYIPKAVGDAFSENAETIISETAYAVEPVIDAAVKSSDAVNVAAETVRNTGPIQTVRDWITELKFLAEHAVESLGDTALYLESERGGIIEAAESIESAITSAFSSLKQALDFVELIGSIERYPAIDIVRKWVTNLKFLAEHAVESLGWTAVHLENEREGLAASAESIEETIESAFRSLVTTLEFVERLGSIDKQPGQDVLKEWVSRLKFLAEHAVESLGWTALHLENEREGLSTAATTISESIRDAFNSLHETLTFVERLGTLEDKPAFGAIKKSVTELKFLAEHAMESLGWTALYLEDQHEGMLGATEKIDEVVTGSFGLLHETMDFVESLGRAENWPGWSIARNTVSELKFLIEHMVESLGWTAIYLGPRLLNSASDLLEHVTGMFGFLRETIEIMIGLEDIELISREWMDTFTDRMQLFVDMTWNAKMSAISAENEAREFRRAMEAAAIDIAAGNDAAGGFDGMAAFAGAGVGNQIAMANGGIITEPVRGIGLRTGSNYLLGEAGPEAVVPLNGNGMNGGGVTVNIQNPTIIAQADREPDNTLNDVAWATSEALRRRGLR